MNKTIFKNHHEYKENASLLKLTKKTLQTKTNKEDFALCMFEKTLDEMYVLVTFEITNLWKKITRSLSSVHISFQVFVNY